MSEHQFKVIKNIKKCQFTTKQIGDKGYNKKHVFFFVFF